MAKTIRQSFDKYLSYEKLMEAHIKSKKGKGLRKEIILFNLKQEEYIMWLYKKLKNQTYIHGGYTKFFVTEPKIRKIEKSKYIDRIVHRWLVNNFLEPIYIPQFVSTTFACIKGRGVHRAALYIQKTMKHCKQIWRRILYIKNGCSKIF